MKTVEKNDFMQEMNLQEMNEVNGGGALLVGLLLGALLSVALDDTSVESFGEGRAAARGFW